MNLDLISVDRSSIALSVLLCGAIPPLATTALLSAQLHRAGTRYLDHFATNESVSDAKVRVTIGDAEPIDAEPTENGIYTIPFPHLARTGSVEVVFNVTATSGDDLLVGGLTLPSDTEPSDRGASSIGAVSSIWISSIPWGIRHPIVLILITFGLGVLFGHLHRSGRFAAAMATGAVAAGILVILAVVALGGNDHDRSSNAVRTTMAAGMSDAPRRLPDGTAFVAKPTQRLLEVRTAAAERETVRPAVNLIGRVHTSCNGFCSGVSLRVSLEVRPLACPADAGGAA